MIVLLGASGYIGQAFQRALQRRHEQFVTLSRAELDYTHYESLVGFLKSNRPSFLINAAGHTGKPNVDACETAFADTLQGNTLFPLTVSHACSVAKIPWGHVSSGCIFNGAIVMEGGRPRVEKDLTTPVVRRLLQEKPEAIRGFKETDTPNFSFRQPPCSFYSGTKALAEESLANDPRAYIWRLRIPFDEYDNARNYLSKVQRYARVYDNVNSLSHRDDFVNACLDLWGKRAPFGIYNVTNPGFVTARQAVEMIQRILGPQRTFEFWDNDEEFYRMAVKTPRSNCVMDTTKLLDAGVKLRSVEEAISDALSRWVPESQALLSKVAVA